MRARQSARGRTHRPDERAPPFVRLGILAVCALAILCAATTATCHPQKRGDDARGGAPGTGRRDDPGLSPLYPSDGPCESLDDGESCYRRCGCEWCGPGEGHGCHTIPSPSGNHMANGTDPRPSNATGPCAGGKPGRRDAFWSCHRDVVAWVAGGMVGIAATVFLVVVGACWCHRKRVAARCCRWRRRGDHRYSRLNDTDEVWLGGYVSMPRYVGP